MARESGRTSGASFNPNWTPNKDAAGNKVMTKEQAKANGNHILKGYFISRKEGVGQEGNSTKYVVKQLDGTMIEFWGTRMIDDQFQKLVLRAGDYFEVEFQGYAKSKAGRTYQVHEVFRDRSMPRMEDYSFPPAAAGTPAPEADNEDDMPF